MKTLESFAENHPMIAGSLGVVSGVVSGILRAVHEIAGVAADIGSIAAALTAVIMLLIVTRRWRRERWEDKATRASIEAHDRLRARDDDDLP
ncbi:MAG: hypothetical protein ABMA13_18350 [Chthoniobacteraceae bacterium]